MDATDSQPAPLRIFCSYSHRDFKKMQQLRRHLAGAIREKYIELWADDELRPGDEFDGEILRELTECDVVLFLVSEHWLASSYIAETEKPAADARVARKEDLKLVPFLIDPITFDVSGLNKREALAKRRGELLPASQWRPTSLAYKAAAEALLKQARDHRAAQIARGSSAAPDISGPPRAAEPLWVGLRDKHERVYGREPLLNDIDRRCATADSRPLVLTGPAGIGKTTAAVEYARRRAADYDIVAVLPAQQLAAFRSAVFVLLERLGLPAREEINGLDTFRSWLATHERWLLILDNVEDYRLVETLLPPQSRGTAIITSRDDLHELAAVRLPVDVLSLDDAIDLLMNESQSSDRDVAEQVALLLGRHPISLKLAAGSIRSGMSISSYADHVRIKLGRS